MRFVPTGRPISQVIAPPWNDYITNNWESAYKTVDDIIWPEPTWKCPPPGEAFDFANPYYETPQQVIDALKSNLSGNGRDQVLYMNTNGSIDQWVYILSKEQKEYFYGHQICTP